MVIAGIINMIPVSDIAKVAGFHDDELSLRKIRCPKEQELPQRDLIVLVSTPKLRLLCFA